MQENEEPEMLLLTHKHRRSLTIQSSNFTLIIQAEHFFYSSWYFKIKLIHFTADLSSCNVTNTNMIYFICPKSAHMGREWEWSTGSCHKHSSGANAARSHFVAHSSLMRDDLKPFIGSKGHPVSA